MDIKDVKHYWDDQSSSTEAAKAMVGGVADFEMIGQLLFEHICKWGWRSHMKVLDVGCGCGRLAKHIKDCIPELKGNYVGYDISKNQIHAAREIIKDDSWGVLMHGDGQNLPFDDNYFDMAMAFSVFTHIDHKLAVYLLTQMHAVLKPGGIGIITFHNKPNANGEGDYHIINWDVLNLSKVCSEIGFSITTHIIEPVGQDVLLLKKL